MVEMQWHSQTKERVTENTNFNLHRRASPRPYLREAGGFRRPTHPDQLSRTFAVVVCRRRRARRSQRL